MDSPPLNTPSTATLLEVARSVDATPALIPVIDQLFEGIDSLGSTPRSLATLLIHCGLCSTSKVLDLACGKGVVGIELAKRTGCAVLGIDGCPAFLQRARSLAASANVTRRCTFVQADIRNWTSPKKFDVALMIGLDGVLDAAARLRPLVRRDGLYVVDDAVLDPRHPKAAMFEGVPDAAEISGAITELGDYVEKRRMYSRLTIASQNRKILKQLRANAKQIAEHTPALRRSLQAFLQRQADSGQILLGPLRPTLWVIRKG